MINWYGKNNENLESRNHSIFNLSSFLLQQNDFNRYNCFMCVRILFLNTHPLVCLFTVPRRWMVPLFMCWVDTGDKIQGKVVLSNLQESTSISMVECIHNYSFFIVTSIFVCNKTLQLQCGQIEPGFVPTLDSLKFWCYPPPSPPPRPLPPHLALPSFQEQQGKQMFTYPHRYRSKIHHAYITMNSCIQNRSYFNKGKVKAAVP